MIDLALHHPNWWNEFGWLIKIAWIGFLCLIPYFTIFRLLALTHALGANYATEFVEDLAESRNVKYSEWDAIAGCCTFVCLAASVSNLAFSEGIAKEIDSSLFLMFCVLFVQYSFFKAVNFISKESYDFFWFVIRQFFIMTLWALSLLALASHDSWFKKATNFQSFSFIFFNGWLWFNLLISDTIAIVYREYLCADISLGGMVNRFLKRKVSTFDHVLLLFIVMCMAVVFYFCAKQALSHGSVYFFALQFALTAIYAHFVSILLRHSLFVKIGIIAISIGIAFAGVQIDRPYVSFASIVISLWAGIDLCLIIVKSNGFTKRQQNDDSESVILGFLLAVYFLMAALVPLYSGFMFLRVMQD